MNTVNSHHYLRENKLFWAILISLFIHTLCVTVIPKIRFAPRLLTSKTLEIELQKPEPVQAAPQPEPPPAEPVKPKPIKKEVVKPKIIPKPVIKPIAPTPVETPEPEPLPTPPPVIAAAPTPEPPTEKIAAPVVKPTPPPPETPPAPSQADIDKAMGDYGNLLGRAIAKHKAYPKIAVMRGWQGDAMLELKIDRDGNVLSAKVRDSSGYEALDKQALEMVKKASPFPKPPMALSNNSFTITVPVSFKLDNG